MMSKYVLHTLSYFLVISILIRPGTLDFGSKFWLRFLVLYICLDVH